MPRRPTRTVPTVLLAGPVGEQDWPHWLAEQLSAAGRDVRTCFLSAAGLEEAQARLSETLAGLPDDGFDMLAHSVGCLIWLHRVAAGPHSPRPARVALVAPPAEAAAPAGWA